MEIIYLNDRNTREIFATMLSKRNLVPIIGAGFTKGQPTSQGFVPDGEEFRKVMLDTLKGSNKSRDIEKIKNKQFHEIAKYFHEFRICCR